MTATNQQWNKAGQAAEAARIYLLMKNEFTGQGMERV